MLGSFLASAEDLRVLARAGQILADDVPRFDYELNPRQDIEVQTVGALLEIDKPLGKVASAALDGRRVARIEQRRKQNLYALANLSVERGNKALQAGQLALAERIAREVLAEVPGHTRALWLLERIEGRLGKDRGSRRD